MRKFIIELLQLIGVSFFVVYGWQLLEFIMIGEIRPNKVDTVVGIILIYSLWGNLITWTKSK